jgi:tripartite-type tricarboxylate transporter receptor subunit TctC
MMKRTCAAAAKMIVSAVLGLACAGVHAQPYPTKPIRMIVPYGPGGGADIALRLLAEKLSISMGQPIVIENRPSAGGILAAQAAIASDPDGYTLVATGAAHALSPAILKSVPYDIAKDLVPVAGVGDFDLGIFVARESPVKTVRDLVALAKSRQRGLTFGIGSFGTVQHVAVEMFRSATHADLTIVPFKTVAQHLTALRGGEIDAVVEILTPMLGYVKDGSLRAVAVPSKARFSGLPEVPTVSESGLPNFVMTAWNIVQAPAKTPREAIDRLNREFNTALRLPDVRKRFEDLGITPLVHTPHEIELMQANEMVRFRSIAKSANIEIR